MSLRKLQRVAVFCGSNFGEGDAYRDAAAALGRELAARRITLVYGGTLKGLMGIVADATIDAGGQAHGVITRRLADRGQLHTRLTGHDVLVDMASRKARMRELADACIALPGGIGTVEEFVEAWTLNQLGDVDKPVGLLDVNGFFDPFLGFVDRMIAEKFLPAAHKDSLVVRAQPGALLDALAAQPVISVSKWMS
ncbi:MAG: TIGR00730 family Rossman fold protein [Variibacter sp.]|nr:TIGR00730 family Rossman fold protein [Variibacter sp.]